MEFDLHIHSKYSYDSVLSPEWILKTAKKKGLDGVAVTDHHTIKGGVATAKINKSDDFMIIIGSEIKTEYGDIIGLFLNAEIKTRDFMAVVDEIRDQAGLVVLAHPYRKGKVFPTRLLDKIDLIEAFNARSPKELNRKALELAKRFEKPITSGSDAHLFFEIGRARTILAPDVEIKDLLLKGETEIEGKESNYYFVHAQSLMIERYKKVVFK
jgi:predicted metal-dependent phosphoesterase TrpH